MYINLQDNASFSRFSQYFYTFSIFFDPRGAKIPVAVAAFARYIKAYVTNINALIECDP